MLLAMLAVAFGVVSDFVKLEWWPFLTLLVEGAILYFVISQIISDKSKKHKRDRQIQNTKVCFLIPRSKYPKKEYNGAPENEKYVNKLTVGIGNYILLLEVESEIDLLFDPIILIFEGQEDNRPTFCGKDNPFVVESLSDGSIRDWWDNISFRGDKKLFYLHHGDTLIDGNKIETKGVWRGKLHIRIPVREADQVDKYLDFEVVEDKDDIPFLKIATEVQIPTHESTTNTINPASTIRTDRTLY